MDSTMQKETSYSSLESSKSKTYFRSVGTFVRLKPSASQPKDLVGYICETKYEESTYATLDIEIPSDSDPGLVHNNKSGHFKYEFDGVFNMNDTQDVIFHACARDKVLDAFNGFNSTIFAYGQTSTGKTYTMFGGDGYHDRGIIPRSISLLFAEIELRKKRDAVFRVDISFTEVYKENIYDLLDLEKSRLAPEQWDPVQLLEIDSEGWALRNARIVSISSEQEALNLLFMGLSNRITVSTKMNSSSSRSHAVFSILLKSSTVAEGKTLHTSGKINLVDLAGSERVYKSKNSNATLVEAKSINLSLHHLEQVILSLRTGQQQQQQQQQLVDAKNSVSKSAAPTAAGGAHKTHVPYRNSVLTNMLRDSLGGNCRTCFILNISIEKQHFEETVSTCRFGQRCGDVKTLVYANAEIDLADQLKDMASKIKYLERFVSTLEDQKQHQLVAASEERERYRQMTEPRPLSLEEKDACKKCVHGLIEAAKIALSMQEKECEEQRSRGIDSKGVFKMSDSLKVDVDRVLLESQDALYQVVLKMDKSVLLELTSAFGGLVQSMYMEREGTKIEDNVLQRIAAKMKAENEAREKAREAAALEQEKKAKQAEEAAIVAAKALSSGSYADLTLTPEVITMVHQGQLFVKTNRYGSKQPRHVFVSQDLKSLCWRDASTSSAVPTVTELSTFSGVEIIQASSNRPEDSCIGLRGASRLLVLRVDPSLSPLVRASITFKWAGALDKLLKSH